MKRVALLTVVALVMLSFIASAAPSDVIEEQTGINPDNVPTDLQSAKEDYLKQNWQELIESNAVLGRLHAFFTKISIVFQVLFGQPYSLSPRLFFVILLWIYIVTQVDSALNAAGVLNRASQMAIALAAGIILAQVHALSFIIGKAADIMFAPESWIARIIAFAVTAAIAIVAHFLVKKGILSLKQSNQDGKGAEQKQAVEEMSNFLKGVRSGQKILK